MGGGRTGQVFIEDFDVGVATTMGAELIEIVPLPEDNDQYVRGEREKCRYRLDL